MNETTAVFLEFALNKISCYEFIRSIGALNENYLYIVCTRYNDTFCNIG